MTIVCGLKYASAIFTISASGITTWSSKVPDHNVSVGVAEIACHLVDVCVVRAVRRPEVGANVDAVGLPEEVVVVPKLLCHSD